MLGESSSGGSAGGGAQASPNTPLLDPMRAAARGSRGINRKSVFTRVSFWVGAASALIGLGLVIFGSTTPSSYVPLFGPSNNDLSTYTPSGGGEDRPLTGIITSTPAIVTGWLAPLDDNVYKWTLPAELNSSALQIGFCVEGPVMVSVKKGSIPESGESRALSFASWDFECASTQNKLSYFQCDMPEEADEKWHFYIEFYNFQSELAVNYTASIQPSVDMAYCQGYYLIGDQLKVFLLILAFCSAGTFLLVLAVVIEFYWLLTNATFRADTHSFT
ncbi:hypothetical protein Pelo_4962 [Pelomyxa schiedti]|nr:hypothetical protein Pelo_4962 [Pelomyxa schiedti]